MKAPRSRYEATSGARAVGEARSPRARSAPRGRSAARAPSAARGWRRPGSARARGLERLRGPGPASSTGSPVAAVDDRAEQLARGRRRCGATDRRAVLDARYVGRASARPRRRRRARRRARRPRSPMPKGASRSRTSSAGEPAGERRRQHVAGEPALGLAHHPLAHQLERDDDRRLLDDQPLEVAEPARASHDHQPGLGGAAPRGETGMRERTPGRSGWSGRTGAAAAPRALRPRRGSPRAGARRSWRAAARASDLAAGVEHHRAAADRGGDRARDLVEAAPSSTSRSSRSLTAMPR